ncbi:XRE family transcriptional regulator [Cupriavidus metallidurans]|uniref:XRE family transcriptional regulator n=1 Tax=Cupriavidus metallidurans TaxID=119219 RepID=UPI001E5B28B8|nr:XRE family transcriptional regulator [Cupriavidus metallidurans]
MAEKASVVASAIADYERGFRPLSNGDNQAIQDTFKAAGIQFATDAVAESAQLPGLSLHRPGGLIRWVDSTHLSQWAERRDGQSGMPELVRRLIFATVGPAAEVCFPAGESVQYPGWDGRCRTVAGSGYVPRGSSVWEIGAQRNAVRSKADSDFDKRSADPLGYDPADTTFVFVTPQRFTRKLEWIAEKAARGVWRDVIVIDSDDLVHWLELYPSVAQWLSVSIGCRPQGLRNLEEVWSEWIRATELPLTTDVILAGRDDDQTVVHKWLRNSPGLLSIQAEAPEEAVAFLFAALSPLPERYRLWHLGRCVVADTSDSARQLIGLGSPLIVALIEADAGLARRLADDGHHVFIAFGPAANGHAGSLRRLRRPWKSDLKSVLMRAGMEETDAHRFAHASGRSITVLRRMLPVAPHSQPEWAKRATPELVAAMFAGAWVGTSPQDRQVISELAGRPYEQVEEVLAALTASVGGPLVRSGDLWKVVSLRDLWMLIGGQVSPSQFERFEETFQTVLSAVNPRFATRPKSIYYEAEGEFEEQPSRAIRGGLTEAIIAIALFPEKATLIPAIGQSVDRAVRKLFNDADAALWWSLSSDFRNLAEAAPDAFLDAIDRGLEGTDPPIASLFRSDEGLFHPNEYLSELLWALEMLARSRDYLGAAATLLARLHEIDPGGKWSNRPFASLRRIFVTWLPQTYATASERLKVIDRIVRTSPAIGWQLLLALAPRPHDVSEPSAKPNWRDFTPEEKEVVTHAAAATAAKAIGERLLTQAGDDPDRWLTLLAYWPRFDKSWRAAAVDQLTNVVRCIQAPADIEAIRDELRGVLAKNRAFAEASWAMDEATLAPLEVIFGMLQPTEIQETVRWLFRPGAVELTPNVDWGQQQVSLELEQRKAAERLVDELSADEIFTFASSVTMHRPLGVAIAATSKTQESKITLMKHGISAAHMVDIEVGLGILYGLKVQAGSEGDRLVGSLWQLAIEEAWGEQAELHLVQALPACMSTWAEIDSRGSSLSEKYWRTLQVYSVGGEFEVAYFAEQLLKADRAVDVVGWMGGHIQLRPDSRLLISSLHAAANAKQPVEGNAATMFAHHVGVILDYLADSPNVNEEEIAGLEWVYYQVLRYSQRSPRKLHRALTHNPAFFVHLVKLICGPEEGSGIVEPEPTNLERMQSLAGQALDVLHDWAQVPGADDQGKIDSRVLDSWVTQSRVLLAESGRAKYGESRIGEILSAARPEGTDAWPPAAVRDVIEVNRSREIERGFERGVYNRRGVTVRMPHDGGILERNAAMKLRRDAIALRFEYPRTAACLERIAEMYEFDATRQDISAEQRDWL